MNARREMRVEIIEYIGKDWYTNYMCAVLKLEAYFRCCVTGIRISSIYLCSNNCDVEVLEGPTQLYKACTDYDHTIKPQLLELLS